eukprot:46287-Prymnesium_polylepis.1
MRATIVYGTVLARAHTPRTGQAPGAHLTTCPDDSHWATPARPRARAGCTGAPAGGITGGGRRARTLQRGAG